MKKIVSLIACVAILFSFVAVSYAEPVATRHTFVVSDTEVNIGDTFTVTLSLPETTFESVAGKIWITKDATVGINCTSVKDGDNYEVEGSGFLDDGGRGVTTTATSAANVNSNNAIGYSLGGSSNKTYKDQTVLVATFTATAAGNVTFALAETFAGEYNSTIGDAAAGSSTVNPVTVTVIDPNASTEPEAPVVGASPVVDAENKAKTWTVDIDADYVAAGDTLTATLYDTTNETDTQEVTLSMGNNVVVGGAAWSFTLKATFENAAKMADIGLRVSK